jgi:hypothetical protein
LQNCPKLQTTFYAVGNGQSATASTFFVETEILPSHEALVFKSLKNQTQVLQVILESAAENTDVIEVDGNELM